MSETAPSVVVLGASGLIGEAVSTWLLQNGYSILAVARRFTASQKFVFGRAALECPFVDVLGEIKTIVSNDQVDVIVNCVGVLQDGPGKSTDRAHREFVENLLKSLALRARPALLIHLSIPGARIGDVTSFSWSKRAAEHAIAERCKHYAILRPGFVVAPAAYGGSALMRALAIAPFALAERELGRPLAVTDCADIARTIAIAANRWRNGERTWRATWDIMSPEPTTVGDIVDSFRRGFGAAKPIATMPSSLLTVGSWAGDFAGLLGWLPPVRSIALRELRRGVTGDPREWLKSTKLVPASPGTIIAQLHTTVQEKWFARLYLLKAVVISALAFFWVTSGLIALLPPSSHTSTTLLVLHGIPEQVAAIAITVGCVADVAIGLAIAFRRSCRSGLIAGLGLSLFYLFAGSVLAPELWSDPLGPLVKILPGIVLTAVALAILEAR